MGDTVTNVHVYAEEWATKLQERLSEEVKWKDICKVDYTNSKVLHNPYLTEATVQTGYRGTAYTYQAISQTDEYVTIDTYKVLPQFIDRADLAQSTFLSQMELADKQGILLNESIESAVYADYGSFTDFGTLSIGGGGAATDQITVSATNIDDIIRGIKREIREAKGEALLNRNGGFIVWRPADLEILEGFMQANGFVTADTALKGGTSQGIQYMGLTHYSSNLLTANHVIAGVKKVYHLGILKATYGQVMIDDKDPKATSGVGIVSRVDFKGKAWANVVPVLFDVNVG